MRLKEKRGILFLLHHGDIADQLIVSLPSISLKQALESNQFSSPKKRLVLAYTLAYSTWQFYESDWLQVKWNSNLIHFMHEECIENESDGPLTISPYNPCLAFDLKDEERVNDEYCRVPCLAHPFSRIIAIGLLLIDIGYGEGRPSRYAREDKLVVKLNTEATEGMRALSDTQFPRFGKSFVSRGHHGTVRETYRDVVRSCFNAKIFRETLPTGKGCDNTAGLYERRRVLYQKVVLPLQQLVNAMGWGEETGDIISLEAHQQAFKNEHENSMPRSRASFLVKKEDE